MQHNANVNLSFMH